MEATTAAKQKFIEKMEAHFGGILANFTIEEVGEETIYSLFKSGAMEEVAWFNNGSQKGVMEGADMEDDDEEE
jgi:hypothetical protein